MYYLPQSFHSHVLVGQSWAPMYAPVHKPTFFNGTSSDVPYGFNLRWFPFCSTCDPLIRKCTMLLLHTDASFPSSYRHFVCVCVSVFFLFGLPLFLSRPPPPRAHCLAREAKRQKQEGKKEAVEGYKKYVYISARISRDSRKLST